jgi:predicted phage terminase large subunit-like protein
MPAHIVRIAEAVQGLIDNQYDRLIITMPPRHSKTQSTTVRLAAYWLENYPTDGVMITSYNERMARRFSRMARTIYFERNKKDNDKSSSDEWITGSGGVCMARGSGNPATGQGFSLIIADDVIKSREEAESQLIREKQWDWWTSDVLSRLEPNGKAIIVATRWHPDDLIGRVIEAEPDTWHVLDLPAICDDKDDPLGREVGEALWPERYDTEALLRLKNVMGDYQFEALYQCNPTPRQGAMFKINNLNLVEALPNDIIKTVRAWDLASTQDDGDYSCGLKMSLDKNNNIYITDVVRGQWGVDERDKVIKQTCDLDGRVPQIFPSDPGAAGKSQINYLFRMLSGHNLVKVVPTGKKEIRAEPIAAQINVGNVYLLKADWNKNFIDELRQFPLGKHDDQVDCLSDAFNNIFNARKFQAF